MSILITNDDGIEAPGIAALYRAAEGLGKRIVVAPRDTLSGCSHRITMDRPIAIGQRTPTSYGIDGTPADCVRLGLFEFAPDVSLVLSGVNAGGNMGADAFYSGTMAAAREACLFGIPSIAFSQFMRRGLVVDWEVVVTWTRHVLEALLKRGSNDGTFWSVNFPHLEETDAIPPMVDCPLEKSPLPLNYDKGHHVFHYQDRYANRERTEGSDVEVCFGGRITVTKVRAFADDA
ncbi:5'-nucleotidase SurE [Planctomycetes bacterium Pan216]|uniref:5'-nucleotidase n=1 Tax=Kolteria novifilia TaxID=2527975 RepID=A0A518B309_9BACT|nr:5'-nucleotidase SurE [Planctomycetes bacterium Pan216]